MRYRNQMGRYYCSPENPSRLGFVNRLATILPLHEPRGSGVGVSPAAPGVSPAVKSSRARRPEGRRDARPTMAMRNNTNLRRGLITPVAGLCTFLAACASSAQAASLPSDWQHEQYFEASAPGLVKRSEERRVGKECRSRW